MKLRTNPLLHFLIGAAFTVCSTASFAMPKAAEHEGAPVTMGADVPKPKHSTKKTTPSSKTKASKKTKSSRKTKTKHPKK